MNKKYFIHFTWIVTLIMLIFTGLCLVDGVSIFVPFFTYITAMILYVGHADIFLDRYAYTPSII